MRSYRAKKTAQNRSATVPISASMITPTTMMDRCSAPPAAVSAEDTRSLFAAMATVAAASTLGHCQSGQAFSPAGASPVPGLPARDCVARSKQAGADDGSGDLGVDQLRLALCQHEQGQDQLGQVA